MPLCYRGLGGPVTKEGWEQKETLSVSIETCSGGSRCQKVSPSGPKWVIWLRCSQFKVGDFEHRRPMGINVTFEQITALKVWYRALGTMTQQIAPKNILTKAGRSGRVHRASLWLVGTRLYPMWYNPQWKPWNSELRQVQARHVLAWIPTSQHNQTKKQMTVVDSLPDRWSLTTSVAEGLHPSEFGIGYETCSIEQANQSSHLWRRGSHRGKQRRHEIHVHSDSLWRSLKP